ncbi:Golgi transport complex subunit 5-domain-containing protein [Desarmillaria tabescens]|uniref:Conserved oligomeric Golgi complex subunit 5 n=1 Tax=Armillaria tabescens TaxID=1929756 RepID=A0AA39K8W7_ARMTA|nr:Golgi transport complex subunit 5-domain-containing protein [Desarmillaria tabescens]KAK0455394.1 Golgi transport complex subunit 5-domain-containing protein [Desarmillaria tabescens]
MSAPADYSVFASAEFDPNDYANAVLAGEPYVLPSDTRTKPLISSNKLAEAPGKEEISIAISKLTFGIDDVSKQIKTLVTNHHQDLLSQAASANELSGSLNSVRAGLADLDHSLEKLRLKVRAPYQSLQANVSRLQKLQQASDVLRRTSRFVILARRLQIQMAEMESVSLLDDSASCTSEETRQSDIEGHQLESRISLRSVNAIAVHVPYIEDARAKVTSEMENMVLTGLTSLNQSLLASSLQTAYNLRVLPELVQNLILELSQAVDDRIRTAFDLSKISKEILSKDSAPSPTLYKSRVRTEPTNLTAPQWTAALWARLEVMIQDMAECCVKVYTLERVLKIKKDTVSHVVFLDEAMKLLENKPSATFWTALARSLEKNTRDAARSSMFLQQTLSTGYPRLLRLFHEFFAKIAVHTDTTYIHTYQSPETVLVLRALSNFESLYLSRSSTKLNESVSQAFSGGIRTPPGIAEGINIARTVANELDSARFDPLLVRAVAKSATTSIDMVISRLDGLVSRDRSSVTLVGPSATPQQAINGSLATFVYYTWLRLSQLGEEQKEVVFNVIKPSVDNLHSAYERIVNPLLTAIRRELGAIVSKMHRFDFGKSADPIAGMGGTSLYMKDLVEKLAYIKAEIFSKFGIGDEKRTWIMSLVQYIIKTFVLHVSIVKPLGEAGKLQLTSDMTELEFALSAFLVESPQEKRGGNLESVGPEYKMLRAMRPLLFLESSQLASLHYTSGLPPLIVLHHILVRSPIPLPHSLHGWQEAEYVRWVDEHTEEEAWTLVDGGLSHWERTTESGGSEKEDAMQYVNLARQVLAATQS